MTEPIRLDRRTTLKWVIAAAGIQWRRVDSVSFAAPVSPGGYGRDPNLLTDYKPGDVWPLTMSAEQRRLAAALCDLILPDDGISPAAAEVGVVDFLDEWISAPYPEQSHDRHIVLTGLAWLDAESRRRFLRVFAALSAEEQKALCDPVCSIQAAPKELTEAAHFFSLFRDLVAAGFYTTPAGRLDLGFVGNVPLLEFEGPSADVMRRVGLA